MTPTCGARPYYRIGGRPLRGRQKNELIYFNFIFDDANQKGIWAGDCQNYLRLEAFSWCLRGNGFIANRTKSKKVKIYIFLSVSTFFHFLFGEGQKAHVGPEEDI